ncbi:hypothetical protein [Alsobacter sp. SYSU BS001988]
MPQVELGALNELTTDQPAATAAHQKTSPLRRVAGVTGWALDFLAILDARSPGLFSAILASGSGRRQAIFAFLSPYVALTHPGPTGQPHGDAKNGEAYELRAPDLDLLIDGILHRESRQLISMAFGASPDGYRGALARVGLDAQPPWFYRRLWAVFADRSMRREQRCLRYMPTIDGGSLSALFVLNAVLRVPGVFERGSADTIRDLNSAVGLLRKLRPGTTEAQFAAAFARSRRADAFVLAWLEGATDYPGPPFPGSAQVRPLHSVAALKKAALGYRNCLMRYMLGVLRGRHAFYEVRDEGGLILHLQRHVLHGWIVSSCNGPENRRPSQKAVDIARAWWAGHGLKHEREIARDDPWEALDRLVSELRPQLHPFDELE